MPPGVRDAFRKREMVNVDVPGNRVWRRGTLTAQDMWLAAYTVGTLEHIMLVLRALLASAVDELR